MAIIWKCVYKAWAELCSQTVKPLWIAPSGLHSSCFDHNSAAGYPLAGRSPALPASVSPGKANLSELK